MSRLLIFGLGVLVGAGAATYGPALTKNTRPLLKEAIKAAVQLAHGAQVQGTGLLEALEDIYAEAVAESRAAPKPVARKRNHAKSRRRAMKRSGTPRKSAEPAMQHA
jgi:hypothetical protein